MILVTYTKESDAGKAADYKWFDSVEDFVGWFRMQGDNMTFSLVKKNRSFTQDGWVKKDVSTINSMSNLNRDTKTFLKVSKIITDKGILFEDIRHCSEEIVDCMALKCEISPT